VVQIGEITEVQLLQLFLEVNQDIDTQFQFWISVTFAVLVASFVADERLSRAERIAITALYFAAAAIVLFRYGTAISYQDDVLGMFDTYGVARPAVATGAGRLRIMLFTFGSLVAAWSVLFPKFLARRRGGASNAQSGAEA